MIFLDTYPSSINTPDSFSTIAHEFQHLINFSNTYLVNGTEQETWINEGLSSGAEYVYSGTVDQDRLDYFNDDPYDTIIFGNNFFVWSGYWENIDDSRDVLANYSTVYLFFQWLRIHASNGIGIYKEILGSSYRDYRAVTSSASVRISSSFNTWAVLLRTWMESNLLNLSTGYKGYLSKISTTSHCFNSLNNYEWYLSPGEGVASINGTGSFAPTAGSGTNVKYIGLTATGIEDTISPYTGTAVLSFNANTLISGYDETCFLASVETTLDSLDFDRIIKIENTLPALFPINVTFKVGGGFEDNSHHIIHSSREKNTANRQQQRILRLVSNLDE